MTIGILVGVITGNLLIVLTAAFDGFSLFCALAALGFPLAFWIGDLCSGLVAWPVMKPPVVETPQAPTFWHLSMSPPEAFAAGIDFNCAKTHFVGAGFYVWESLDAAIRYVPHGRPCTLLRFTVDPDQWQRLTKRITTRKWSWAYFERVSAWMIASRSRASRKPRPPSSDVLIIPAMAMPSRWRQIVFRDTPGSRRLFETVTVAYWPIVCHRRSEIKTPGTGFGPVP